jgi:16S rRNA G966 N2-methylase RsmD
MIADAMRDCSHRGGIVLDIFGGSGSALIAAHRTGRRARLVEIDPIYCDRTIRRWQTLANDDTVLLTSGETFTERETQFGWSDASAGPAAGVASDGEAA